MKVSKLAGDTKSRLYQGLVIGVGPFNFLLRSVFPDIVSNLTHLYADFSIVEDDRETFCDFHITVKSPSLLRHFFSRQAQFYVDDRIVFNPFPLVHATAMLEWGMNWCVSTQIHTYLIVHAAVIEKNGLAAILPAPPGSGKSTLCASLIQEGWRLLSDELALIDLKTHEVVPMPRPVGLKNQSIDIIKQRYPNVIFGVVSSDTIKGSVCHIKPPQTSIVMQYVACRVGWIIFPKYEANAATDLAVRSKAQAFMEIANNAFNYSLLGVDGFDVLKKVVDRADCFDFKYSNLDEAIAVFNQFEPSHEI